MTKSEITQAIASKTGLDKKEVLTIVESFMQAVKESVAGGEEVYLRGFGSFIIKHRATKTGRDIAKNTTVLIPEHDIPSFRPAKEFMQTVKNAAKDKITS